jgi:hypothetical protein
MSIPNTLNNNVMKILCINDRQFNINKNKYSIKKSKSITKNNIYTIDKVEKVNGEKHYWITTDSGWKNYYHHSRFIKLSLPNKLKLL